MYYADEVRRPEEVPHPKVRKAEVEMAKTLIDNMSAKWDPEKYRDDYREALMEVIEEKVESGGKEIKEKPKPKRTPTNVIDLVSVLQESLAKTQGTRKKSPRKHAARNSTRHRQ
jgi:DNA end-binding protein Ku